MVVFDVAENKAAQYVTDVDAIMKCNKLPWGKLEFLDRI